MPVPGRREALPSPRRGRGRRRARPARFEGSHEPPLPLCGVTPGRAGPKGSRPTAAPAPRLPRRGERGRPLPRAAPGPGGEAQARRRMARELLTHGPAPRFLALALPLAPSRPPPPLGWLRSPGGRRGGAPARPVPSRPPLTILLPPTAAQAPGQRGGGGGHRSGSDRSGLEAAKQR